MNPKVKSDISWQRIGTEVLIMDTTYLKQAHSLNSTAALVWQHLNGKNSPKQLASILSEEFEIDESSALNDVEALLERFRKLQLIEG
ncbi:MAG: hypothetical protein CME71_10230 [Halobacteriovorax sp.]|nr:hypothetical protein [Halobacteriovorax sp.]|tara:strand:- start:498 stop:758 length:261 start_codon:yes stop_codon:yes gene_type:complete